jgi:hypothetical protein
MSKRPTKKAGKKWKVGDRVSVTGEITFVIKSKRCVMVSVDGDTHSHFVDYPALRPAVEVFAWKPEKKPTPKGAKKK